MVSASRLNRVRKAQKPQRPRCSLGFKQYSWSSSYSPRPDQALLHGKWSLETPSVYAVRTIQEIDPRSLYSRQVGNIHVVLQASLEGYGGYLETDIIYTDSSLTSEDKETLTDHDAISRCLRPFYLRSAATVSEVFQPEIDVEHCRLLGRRTVGLSASNGQASLSLQGIQPENNRWIIPFSSKLLDGHRFYVINRFFCHTDNRSVLYLSLMVAMYPEVAAGGLDIPPGNNYYSRLMKTTKRTMASDTDDKDNDPFVIDETDDEGDINDSDSGR